MLNSSDLLGLPRSHAERYFHSALPQLRDNAYFAAREAKVSRDCQHRQQVRAAAPAPAKMIHSRHFPGEALLAAGRPLRDGGYGSVHFDILRATRSA